ncbi:hypothetical protein [Actinacidiphila oryziradicis]|uniref:Uncharacterized protein n=1 Tax=Actinacidiphila oryziradicis TaxID=2571141 RepID=A0A4U0SYP0_9ACTN|nr:hypothetical protein [Actinacidiphila oryziradicis]TKA13187.1 hypothetical protein FCI23_00115 [Actinacidiphila oryziradicis]
MIELISTNVGDTGYTSPAFVCDTCREQAFADGMALVLWMERSVDGLTERSPMFVVHKRTCGQAATHSLGGPYPRVDDWHDMTMELSVFIEHLATNAERPVKGRKRPHSLVLRSPAGGAHAV